MFPTRVQELHHIYFITITSHHRSLFTMRPWQLYSCIIMHGKFDFAANLRTAADKSTTPRGRKKERVSNSNESC